MNMTERLIGLRRFVGKVGFLLFLALLPFGLCRAAEGAVSDVDVLPPLADSVMALIRTNASKGLSERISIVTNAPLTVSDKVQALGVMLAGEKREAQRRLAHLVVRLADDESFVYVRRLMLEPGWHPQIHSALMSGTLKRSNSVKLPVLMDLARKQDHPQREEAKQLLAHLLAVDHGSDWAAWEKAMKTWLITHP
jgi:hypothetical protein